MYCFSCGEAIANQTKDEPKEKQSIDPSPQVSAEYIFPLIISIIVFTIFFGIVGSIVFHLLILSLKNRFGLFVSIIISLPVALLIAFLPFIPSIIEYW